jgi:perosamine synthetase
MAHTLDLTPGTRRVKNPPVEKWVKVNAEVKAAVNALMDQGITTIGDGSGVVGEFETAFAKLVGARYALTMNSGTSALHCAYFAAGVGPGDEVLVPTYTWHATITPILHCAATPVFCDIDPKTLTIDPDDIERKITPRTKAIAVVHVWGNVCDMDRIVEIARRHKLALIEDCSHAHGATWRGRPVGSFGAIGCFSMQGGKPVSGGECGVATTNDPELFDRMVLLGHFGRKRNGGNPAIASIGDMSLGAKYRPHAWAVAMANVELGRLAELNRLRSRNYAILNDRLRNCPGIEVVEALPHAVRGGYLEFKFTLSPEALRHVDRKVVAEAMQANGAPVAADRYSEFNYTYGLLHTAPLFTAFDLRSIGGCFYDPSLTPAQAARCRQIPSLPASEDVARRIIGLYAYVDVTPESMAEVAEAMAEVMERVAALGG